MDRAVSRRAFFAGVAGTVAALRAAHAQEVPTITNGSRSFTKWRDRNRPNDLQFVAEGLWVLDQVDQPTNKAFLVKPEDGSVIREIQTEALHASGITMVRAPCGLVPPKARTRRIRPRR